MPIAAAAITGGGALLGGLIGSSGQRAANKANERIARENRAFQERMSSTAYQRAATDLEKAGLNRILALGSPASSPGGSTAVMQNPKASIAAGVTSATTTAINAAQQIATIENIKAQSLKAIADAKLTESKSDVISPAAGVASDLAQLYNKIKSFLGQSMKLPGRGGTALSLQEQAKQKKRKRDADIKSGKAKKTSRYGGRVFPMEDT